MKANAETSAAGLAKSFWTINFVGQIQTSAGANAYPIVSLTWILAYPESGTPGVKRNSSLYDKMKSRKVFQILWDMYLSQSLFDRKHLLPLTRLNKNHLDV